MNLNTKKRRNDEDKTEDILWCDPVLRFGGRVLNDQEPSRRRGFVHRYQGNRLCQKSKKKAKKKAKQKEEEGVITSLADAYKAVDDLLTQRDLSVLKRKEELTQEQKDSIAAVQRIEEEAYETAKEEVDAALAYARTTLCSEVRPTVFRSPPDCGYTTL